MSSLARIKDVLVNAWDKLIGNDLMYKSLNDTLSDPNA